VDGPGLPKELDAPKDEQYPEDFDCWEGKPDGPATGGGPGEVGKLKGAGGGWEPNDE